MQDFQKTELGKSLRRGELSEPFVVGYTGVQSKTLKISYGKEGIQKSRTVGASEELEVSSATLR